MVAFEDEGLVKWGAVRDEEEEERRLEQFGRELEEEEDGDDGMNE